MLMIVTATDDGSYVRAYDEQRNIIFMAPSSPDGGLKGYTSNSLSIERSGIVYVYDARGNCINVIPHPRRH